MLIRHADSSVQQLARTTDDLLTQSQASVSQAGASIEATTLAATEALQAAAELSDTARARMQEAGVSTTISNLAVASEHLANSAAASEETIESIRAIVSPQRKGFWRRLMEAFIPRPTQATPQPTASR